MKEKVVILGASNNPSRYAHMAFKLLEEYGHETLAVSPNLDSLEGKPVYKSLSEIKDSVDTLTMYVGPERSSLLKDQILGLGAKRVIFNPGSENPELEEALKEKGVEVVEGCTLVMLKTKQF